MLLGLGLLGVGLPVSQPGAAVPLWQDVIAAGVAVFAYSVFYSTPLTMLAWPMAVGMLAHAMRWGALSVSWYGAATGAGRVRYRGPGADADGAALAYAVCRAIGFASVVSMIPGVFLFRMASGLVLLAGGPDTNLQLASATIADGMTALLIIMAISFGLIVPKLVIDWIGDLEIGDAVDTDGLMMVQCHWHWHPTVDD